LHDRDSKALAAVSYQLSVGSKAKVTTALLHGQSCIARDAVQIRGDIRSSLSGRVREPTASNYSNRRIRRGPLHVRRRDLRSRIAEGHRGCEGLPQTERYGVFVRRLREKIERDPRHPRYLKTLRGVGYRFESGR